MENTSNNEVTYLGPNELLKKLEEKKMQNPQVTFNKTTMSNINSTGKLITGQFPLTIRYQGSENSMIPDKTTVYGYVIENKTPKLDSIYAPEMDSITKATFFNSMQIAISQVTLPEQKLKLNQSFSREMPMNIPVGKFTFNLTNTITYTLKKIENQKAYFDIVQVYTMKSKETDLSLKATGSGNGQIIYDIENTFYLLYELNSTINMEVFTQEMNFKVLTKSTTKQTTTITK